MNPGAAPRISLSSNITSEQLEILFLDERTTTDRDQCEVRSGSAALLDPRDRQALRRGSARILTVVESAPGGETYALPHECTGAIAKSAQQKICEAGE